MEQRFLTTDEAADLLRIKKQTLFKWICEGKLPSYRIGGRTIFSEKELLEWVASRKRDVLTIKCLFVGKFQHKAQIWR